MRIVSLFICILGLPSALFASNNPLKPAATPAEKPGQVQEEVFKDPFATDSDSAPTPTVKVSDPLEPLNRAMYKFDDKLYFWVLKPVATGFKVIAPRPVREHLSLFFQNTKFPIRFANTLLQGRLKGTGIETGRFLINTTVGLAGFFDPASRWDLKLQKGDFDQTLGFYKIPTGCYIVWPLLGPSSVRGTVGMAGDAACSPLTYIHGADWLMLAKPAEILNTTSLRIGEYEAFKKANLDPYVSMRSSYFEYWENRDKKKN